MHDADTLLTRFLAGDVRALARALSLVEAGHADGETLLRRLRARAGRARIIGVTGSPGSGKSTLTDKLIAQARAQSERVAVLAVDPSSPFSGGAILGDRIRMMRWYQDPGVFIRSMATRGRLGGLAAATLQALVLLDAFGVDVIVIETVGVGQSEVDIVRVADSTVLVLTPGAGDGVQAFKAGIMEIGDIFVVNKADLPGAERLKREIKAALELAHPPTAWQPPVLSTIASSDEGVSELWQALKAHGAHLEASGARETKRAARARFEISAQLSARLQARLAAQEAAFVAQVLSGELSLDEALRQLIV
jgi:LAO/AO transport system kinase